MTIFAEQHQPQAVSNTLKRNIAEERQDARLCFIDRLNLYGPEYIPPGKRHLPPDRNWSSRDPNNFFIEAYAAGTFGKSLGHHIPILREKDLETFQEAVAVCEGWRWKPWVAPCRVGAPIRTKYIPDAVARPSGATGKMDKAAINKAYEAYAVNKDAEAGNLKAALYAFAPLATRLNQCKHVLANGGQNVWEPADILSDFVVDLIERLTKGQYKTHDGRFDHWIAFVWKRGFFPEFQRKLYDQLSRTTEVVEESLAEHSDEGQELGVAYRGDVDREQSERNEALSRDETRQRLDEKLEQLAGVWDQLSERTKIIINRLSEGATQEQAAKAAGITSRQARVLLKGMRSAVAGQSQVIGSLQAESEDAETHPDASNRSCIHLVHEADVSEEDNGCVLDLEVSAA